LADALKKASPRKLTLLPLMAATYFMVAGGPYGLEDIVKDSGYFWTVVFLLVVPILWSIPTALMVSELSAALPEEGGYYAWVRRAMGPFWGVQEAWLSLAASAFDMAIYPTLFVKYLDFFFKTCQQAIPEGWPVPAEVAHPLLIAIGMIAVCVLVNILGIRAVGGSSLILNLLLLLPFVVLTVLALGASAPPREANAPPGFDVIITGLVFAMWNYMGWDNASTVAGEVDRPQRTYPLAMILTALLVTLTYILPVFAVARIGVPASEWETGAWVKMGDVVWGPLLAIPIALGGMIGAFGSFNALVMSYSRIPLVLAAEGYLPRCFQRCHPRTGAPWVAILACAVAWSLMLPLKLERMLALDVIVYGLSLLLEFVALIVLRVREPGLPRPFRVPGGVMGAQLIAVGPAVLIGLGIYHERYKEAEPLMINVLLFCAILVAVGPVIYFASEGMRQIALRDNGVPRPRGGS
jgi:amino acid transporter